MEGNKLQFEDVRTVGHTEYGRTSHPASCLHATSSLQPEALCCNTIKLFLLCLQTNILLTRMRSSYQSIFGDKIRLEAIPLSDIRWDHDKSNVKIQFILIDPFINLVSMQSSNYKIQHCPRAEFLGTIEVSSSAQLP